MPERLESAIAFGTPNDNLSGAHELNTIDSNSDKAMCLEYAGIRIAVRTTDAATLVWLEEFLCPAFQRVDCDDPNWTVSLDFDKNTYDSLADCAPAEPAELVDCFTLDGSFKRFRILQRSGMRLVLVGGKKAVFYNIDKPRSTVKVHAPSNNHSSRLALMRVIRELATMHAICRGDLHVHGAAFEHQGQAFVLAGVKRSGKTSLLIHAIHNLATRFMSNDRLFLRFGRVATVVRPMPTIFKIRPETLDLLPEFGRRYRNWPFDFRETLEESNDGIRTRRKESFGDTTLTPRLTTTQFCDLMDVAAVGETKLGAIVFPRVAPEARTIQFQRLEPHVATAKLFYEGLLRAGSPQRTSQAFCESEEPLVLSNEHVRGHCEQIASQVPCYVCELGPSAYHRPLAFRQLTRQTAERSAA